MADVDHEKIKQEQRANNEGYESGRHNQYPSAMRRELERLARESEARGDLPEYSDRLREIANTYERRAQQGHRGGGKGSGY